MPPHESPGKPRRFLLAVAFAFVFLLPPSPAAPSAGGGASHPPRYEERASVEKQSRSRYRRLEVASAVILLVGGTGAILWLLRRK